MFTWRANQKCCESERIAFPRAAITKINQQDSGAAIFCKYGPGTAPNDLEQLQLNYFLVVLWH